MSCSSPHACETNLSQEGCAKPGAPSLVCHWLTLALGLVLLAGCGGGSPPETAPVTLNLVMAGQTAEAPTEFHRLWAQIRHWFPVRAEAWAAGVADIALIRVEVSAPDISPPQRVEQAVSNPASGQTIAIDLDVRAGSNRTLTVSALNAAGAVIFMGTATGVNLSTGIPVTITITLASVTGVGIGFPPEVVARNPDSGATNVPTNATVTAIFNTDMDTGTITTSTFTMTDQSGFTVQGSVSYDPGTKTATFNPGGLGASTAYTVRLTTGMKDQTGVALASDVVWSFTTSTTLLPLVSGLNQLQGLGVDDSFVYFTERGPTPGTGTVKRIPKNGGTVTTLASNLDFPSAFASDSTSIYVVENGIAKTVKKISKTDGTVTTLVSTGLVNPVGGTVDANFVYFVDLGSTSGTGRIGKVPVGGGSETNVATGLNFPFGGPVVDNVFLYFSEIGIGSGKIRKVPLGGGAVTDLATGLFTPQPTVSVDSTFVYFGEAGFSIGSGMIKKVPLDPGGSVFALASGQRFNVSFPIAMRLDNSYVYFVENMPVTSGGGTVKKVSVNGGTVVTLASGLDVPNRLAFDSTHVYFSEFAAGVSGAGTIMKVPK